MKHKYTLLFLPFALIATAQAATTLGGVSLGPIDGLGANSTFAIWNTVNSPTLTGQGSFPGATMWGPQNSQAGSTDSNAKLIKVANGPTGGGPYGAGGSIYFGGFSGNANVNGGTIAVSTTVPIADLQSVLFQVQIGEASGYDFFNDTLPVLNYTLTGSSTIHTLTASSSSLYDKFNNGTVEMPTGTEVIWVNSYALWFDMSDVEGTVSSFNVAVTGVQHSQVYGLSLQQGDEAFSASMLPVAVPEPSAALLGGIGALALLRRRRK